MTRRKRTPSPDRAQKRVAFSIPASLQHLSALSRSLAKHNVTDQENDNSSIVARAQQLSQPPTNEQGPSYRTNPQSPTEIRFKYDRRQFPDQQKWPQPVPNQGAAGHARFLEKQWQAAKAVEAAEQMKRAQYMERQIEQNRQCEEERQKQIAAAASNLSGQDPASRSNTPSNRAKQKHIEFISKHQREFSETQQWPQTTPRNYQRQFGVDIEQRRQSIIAKLMENRPASIAISSTNIQIPTIDSLKKPVSEREPPAESDTPLDLMTQQNQIAALIARKRVQNAASGTLNRWLQAQEVHRRLQGQTKPGQLETTSQPESQNKPENVFVFHPHPSNLATQQSTPAISERVGQEGTASAPQDEPNQEIDLLSLFSSRGPSPEPPREPNPQSITEQRSGEDDAQKSDPAQLPSPSPSSSSQAETQRAASPSAQLLMNLANAAPAASTEPPQHSTFPTPSLIVAIDGLTRSSSAPRQRSSTARSSVSVEGPLTYQQQEMRLIQRQSEQQQREQNLRNFQQMQAAQAQTQYAQYPTHQQGKRPQSSTSTGSNPTGYYKFKPHLWDGFGVDKFAMDPPSYVQPSPSNDLGLNASNSSSNYGMGNMGSLDSSSVYPGPRGAMYGSFSNGGGANANFRMSTQNNFGVPKR